MKSILKLMSLSLFVLVVISCEKDDDLNSIDVAGTYEGTLIADVSGKSSDVSKTNAETPATADITMVGDQIQVHCYNDDFDTTVMLDGFRDNDGKHKSMDATFK